MTLAILSGIGYLGCLIGLSYCAERLISRIVMRLQIEALNSYRAKRAHVRWMKASRERHERMVNCAKAYRNN